MVSCGFCQTTEEDLKLLLYDTEFWSVFLAENQSYFGRCIVILRRHCPHLGELDPSEWDALRTVVVRLEQVFTRTLGATMFNWTCLMNKAYQAEDPTPHVHLHLRPRFSKPVDFAGFTFEDSDFSRHYDSKRVAVLPKHITTELVSRLRVNIKAMQENSSG